MIGQTEITTEELDFNKRGEEKEEEEDGNEDDYEMGNLALPVTPFDVNSVNLDLPPLTAQEYLQQVIAERTRLPRVVTVSVPKLNINSPSSSTCQFLNEQIDEYHYSPSKRWQQLQVSKFSDLRYRIECDRESWQIINMTKLPRCKSDWFTFLFDNTSENVVVVHEPYLDSLLQMSNEIVENVIKYIIEWIREDTISVYTAGSWLFGLLACIEVPICIKMMKQLRILVHICRNTRHKMDFKSEENKIKLTTLNLFICIIGNYFGQRDLAD